MDDAEAPLSARELQVRLEDRYLGLKARLERVTERMHPTMGVSADLDGLEALADGLGRVALHGDRIEVTSAQRVAAERKRAELEAGVAAMSGRDRHEPLPVEGPSAGPLPERLVVKQRPPVARAGRGRGFRLKEDAEAEKAEAAARTEADAG